MQPNSSTNGSEPASFTVEALNQQIRARVIGCLHYGFKSTQRQVVVQGQIGEIRPTSYRLHYAVPLKGDGGQRVFLDIEKELVARVRLGTGDYVEVTGLLAVDDGTNQTSKVDIRIAVSAVKRIGYPQTFECEERATVEFMRSLGYRRCDLPSSIEVLSISLIHPQSEMARVQDDFLKQMAGVQHLFELQRIAVPMNKHEGIADAIQGATGNVLVLIRGGGDAASFDVFDQKPVLQAWAEKEAYKAVGLGHEGTGASLIEFVSDYVGSTPTAVGAFLSQRIAEMKRQREQAIQAQTYRAQLEEHNRSLKAQLANADQSRTLALLQTADAGKLSRDRLIIAAAFLVGVFFVIGVLVGYYFAR